MIDIDRTRAQLLAELECLPSDPRIRSETPLSIRGHAVKEVFSLLKAELLERFADVPRAQLIRNLLAPLKNGIGNAYKHGNRRDLAKWISVEIVPARKGALLAITDEGPGFDVSSTLSAMRESVRDSSDRGAGFRNLERADSV